MTRLTLIALAILLSVSTARAEDETVPSTVEGGSRTFTEGGQQIGEGFRGIGRGIKKMFTGERSKEEFKEGAKIGTGFRDVGIGTAGVGRGVGREVKEGFTEDKGEAAEQGD